MRRRARFMAEATHSGWDWLVEVSNHVGLAALIVAFAFGVSVFGGWKLPHWWYGLLIIAAFYAVLFGEGAYRVYDGATAGIVAVARSHAEHPALRPLREQLVTASEVQEQLRQHPGGIKEMSDLLDDWIDE